MLHDFQVYLVYCSRACWWPDYVGNREKKTQGTVAVTDLNEKRILVWDEVEFCKFSVSEYRIDNVVAKVRGWNLFFSFVVDKAIVEADVISILVNRPVKMFSRKHQVAYLKYVKKI